MFNISMNVNVRSIFRHWGDKLVHILAGLPRCKNL